MEEQLLDMMSKQELDAATEILLNSLINYHGNSIEEVQKAFPIIQVLKNVDG